MLSAWLFALFSPLGTYTITYTPPPPGSRLSSASRVPADFEQGTHVLRRGPGMRYELVTEMMWLGSRLAMMMERTNRSVERVEVGWPFPAMEWTGSMDVRRSPGAWSMRDGVKPPMRSGQLTQGAERRLPLVVLWPGFAINTGLASLLVSLTLVSARAARRARRRRRRQCPSCGYDVRGLPGAICPECGRP